jgi:hypothetical protein
VGRGSDGDRTRSGRRRLPHPAFPNARRDFSWTVDPNDLDVRAAGKSRVRFEQRSDALDLVRVSDDDCMWIAHQNRDDGNAGDDLSRTDRHLAEVLLDLTSPEHGGDDLPLADANRDSVRAGAFGEPGGGDASSVPRKLGLRAVWVPDDDVQSRVTDENHFHDTVTVAHEVAHLDGVEKPAGSGLDDNVRVTER